MAPTEPKDNDPTGEEVALEFDGTRTDQLDDTYRMRIASMSENENLESDDRMPTVAPLVVDKSAGYNPYDTVIEAEPLKDSSARSRAKSSGAKH